MEIGNHILRRPLLSKHQLSLDGRVMRHHPTALHGTRRGLDGSLDIGSGGARREVAPHDREGARRALDRQPTTTPPHRGLWI